MISICTLLTEKLGLYQPGLKGQSVKKKPLPQKQYENTLHLINAHKNSRKLESVRISPLLLSMKQQHHVLCFWWREWCTAQSVKVANGCLKQTMTLNMLSDYLKSAWGKAKLVTPVLGLKCTKLLCKDFEGWPNNIWLNHTVYKEIHVNLWTMRPYKKA